jgi:CRP-like cAMP-binding protein
MNQGPGAVYPISAKSMGQTRVLRMPKSLFRSYWQTDALVQSRMNGLLYQRMSTIQDDKTMSTSPLRVRIAHLLLRHLDQESEFVSQNLSLNLTRQEIADALGVAVESVIRAMREWVEDGTITRSADTKLERINIQKLVVLLDS